MPPPEEIELKLEVPANRVGAVASVPLLKGVKPDQSKTLRSVYFDTDKQKLRKKGLSLRVRRVDGGYVQTIKQRGGRSVGLFERHEWETDIEGRQPDLQAARGTALEPLLSKKLRRNLKPVFETRVKRRVYPIHQGDSEIEFTVDKGKVLAAGRSSPLCEIELELKNGEPGELFELARALDRSVPVVLASQSKAGHGYALVSKDGALPAKAEPVALKPDVDWATAFQTIGRACLYQLAANEPALRNGDAEGVHQMRIGIRRLRAAISLFKDMLSGPQTEAMKTEFKWLTGELGPARELDVFVKRVVKDARNNGANGSGIGAVAEDFRKRRARALRRAEDAVASARFRHLVLDAAAWIEIGDWTQSADEIKRALRERPVVAAAAAELRRHRKKIRKQGKKLAELDARRRHKLRIGAKKLRYATEFFAGAFAAKKSRRRREKFVAKLKALQDALGDLNDIVVHEGLVKQTIESHNRGGKRGRRIRKAFAAGRLSGGEDARFAPVMKEAERAYAAFAKAAPFWP